LLVEKEIMGGQIAKAEVVENYPGFPQGISGVELGELMYQQAIKYGLETAAAEVTGVELGEGYKVVHTSEGSYETKAVIIAAGSEHKKLGITGEGELRGRGVSYCATCDGPLFANQKVVVVGGGNAAITEALYLTKFASKVIVIHRRSQLRADKVLQHRASASPKIEFLWNTVVEEILGGGEVRGLKLHNVKTGEKFALEVSGIFIYVGLKPNTDYLRGILPLGKAGHILTNELMETKIGGIFAAGDIRHNSAQQAITAAGDGATATLSAERFIQGG
jgi:thioredoxin reductase (NADPH)